MNQSRFTAEQIVGILREQEAGEKTADACRRHGVSSATCYARKAKDGGLEVSDAKRLKSLEEENGKLKRLLGESGDARRQPDSGRASRGSLGDARAAGVPSDRRGPVPRPLSQ